MFDIQNDLGHIHFSKNIIRTLCEDAVDSCDGKAAVFNFKGKGKNKAEAVFNRKGHPGNDEIIVEGEEDQLRITVYVVIRFGASIKGVAEQIINSIFDQLEEVFEVEPAQVTVINTGTASRDIIPRYMEFTRTRSQ